MAAGFRAFMTLAMFLALGLASGCSRSVDHKPRDPARKARLAKKHKMPGKQATGAPAVTFQSAGPSPGFTLAMADGVSMEFIRLGRGWYIMGDESGDIRPHKATIERPFFLGKYEVTQAQWELVMGANPSLNKRPENPVNRVSWSDCQKFVTRMNERYQRPGQKFCLPTEVQWEYACRAGFGSFGDGEDSEPDPALDSLAWHAGNSGNDVHPVGQKQANAWGFYDMLGNVAEWCDDDPRLPLVKPLAAAQHVVRGGGYHDGDSLCNVAGRYVRRDVVPFRFDGLRLACVDE